MTGTCEVCQRTDVMIKESKRGQVLGQHRKVRNDKTSQHCSGVGTLAN